MTTNRAIFFLFFLLHFSTIFSKTKVIEFDNPKITIFLPPKGMENGGAIIDCPGGGYSMVALDHEGYQWAPFFNNLGYVYAVVDYKLPDGDFTKPIKDIETTFKLLKDNYEEWNIEKDKIGIMGFSAGGHLASVVSTHAKGDWKPMFQILFYPVISMEEGLTHYGTKEGFLGPGPTKELIDEWSSEKRITPDTPPAFIVFCGDDKVVSPLNSILYYTALIEKGVAAELIAYPSGGHGWGFNNDFKQHNLILQELTDWLSLYGK